MNRCRLLSILLLFTTASASLKGVAHSSLSTLVCATKETRGYGLLCGSLAAISAGYVLYLESRLRSNTLNDEEVALLKKYQLSGAAISGISTVALITLIGKAYSKRKNSAVAPLTTQFDSIEQLSESTIKNKRAVSPAPTRSGSFDSQEMGSTSSHHADPKKSVLSLLTDTSNRRKIQSFEDLEQGENSRTHSLPSPLGDEDTSTSSASSSPLSSPNNSRRTSLSSESSTSPQNFHRSQSMPHEQTNPKRRFATTRLSLPHTPSGMTVSIARNRIKESRYSAKQPGDAASIALTTIADNLMASPEDRIKLKPGIRQFLDEYSPYAGKKTPSTENLTVEKRFEIAKNKLLEGVDSGRYFVDIDGDIHQQALSEPEPELDGE